MLDIVSPVLTDPPKFVKFRADANSRIFRRNFAFKPHSVSTSKSEYNLRDAGDVAGDAVAGDAVAGDAACSVRAEVWIIFPCLPPLSAGVLYRPPNYSARPHLLKTDRNKNLFMREIQARFKAAQNALDSLANALGTWTEDMSD